MRTTYFLTLSVCLLTSWSITCYLFNTKYSSPLWTALLVVTLYPNEADTESQGILHFKDEKYANDEGTSVYNTLANQGGIIPNGHYCCNPEKKSSVPKTCPLDETRNYYFECNNYCYCCPVEDKDSVYNLKENELQATDEHLKSVSMSESTKITGMEREKDLSAVVLTRHSDKYLNYSTYLDSTSGEISTELDASITSSSDNQQLSYSMIRHYNAGDVIPSSNRVIKQSKIQRSNGRAIVGKYLLLEKIVREVSSGQVIRVKPLPSYLPLPPYEHTKSDVSVSSDILDAEYDAPSQDQNTFTVYTDTHSKQKDVDARWIDYMKKDSDDYTSRLGDWENYTFDKSVASSGHHIYTAKSPFAKGAYGEVWRSICLDPNARFIHVVLKRITTKPIWGDYISRKDVNVSNKEIAISKKRELQKINRKNTKNTPVSTVKPNRYNVKSPIVVTQWHATTVLPPLSTVQLFQRNHLSDIPTTRKLVRKLLRALPALERAAEKNRGAVGKRSDGIDNTTERVASLSQNKTEGVGINIVDDSIDDDLAADNANELDAYFSGLREIYIGRLLYDLPHISRYVDYFEESARHSTSQFTTTAADTTRDDTSNNNETVDGTLPSWTVNMPPISSINRLMELWLVFANEGISLLQAVATPDAMNNGVVVMTEFGKYIQLPEGQHLLREIIRQMLYGLADAHKRLIVHRDIKPSNIFIRIEDSFEHVVVRIGDWGSAIHRSPDFCSSTGKLLLYNTKGPSAKEESSAYAPPEALFHTILPYKSNKAEHSVDESDRGNICSGIIGSNSNGTEVFWRNFSYDIWGVGLILLELVIGNTNVLEANDSLKRKEALLRRRIPESLLELGMYIHVLNELCLAPTIDSHLVNSVPELKLIYRILNIQSKRNKDINAVVGFTRNCTDGEFESILKSRSANGNGLIDHRGRDLLLKLLSFDPETRITAAEALEHPWLLKH